MQNPESGAHAIVFNRLAKLSHPSNQGQSRVNIPEFRLGLSCAEAWLRLSGVSKVDWPIGLHCR